MKNSHFRAIILLASTTLLLSGCGATTTQQTGQTPSNIVTPVVNTPQSTVKPTNPTSSPTVAVPTPKPIATVYNMTEVNKHNNANDCWVVISGVIYDVTSYAPQHPGGPDKVLRNCGKDGTNIFDVKHSPDKKQYLTPYYVANLSL